MVLLSIDWTNLHELLRSLYDEMMPLCEDMASVAKGVAGIGALFYVAYRVWQSLSRAEEIDVFPLFRPFVLGLCIMFFPTMVLGTINGILSPVCSATSSLVEQQTFDMKKYQEELLKTLTFQIMIQRNLQDFGFHMQNQMNIKTFQMKR